MRESKRWREDIQGRNKKWGPWGERKCVRERGSYVVQTPFTLSFDVWSVCGGKKRIKCACVCVCLCGYSGRCFFFFFFFFWGAGGVICEFVCELMDAVFSVSVDINIYKYSFDFLMNCCIRSIAQKLLKLCWEKQDLDHKLSAVLLSVHFFYVTWSSCLFCSYSKTALSVGFCLFSLIKKNQCWDQSFTHWRETGEQMENHNHIVWSYKPKSGFCKKYILENGQIL